MEQNINDNTGKVKGELRQKGNAVLEWLLTIIFFALINYLVFKPVAEFMLLVEYNIKLGILEYFIR